VALGAAGVTYYMGWKTDAGVRNDLRAGREVDHEDIRAADSYAVATLVLGATGLAAVGTGAALVLLSNSESGEPIARMVVTPGNVMLAGKF
jgi:hypothetical protein